MANTDYKEYYRGLTIDTLKEEKQKQESTIKNQTFIAKSISLAPSIALIVFGAIFSIVIIGIPFLVVGILGLQGKIRARYQCNKAISEAKARLEAIEECIAEKDKFESAKQNAIEAEIV